MKKGLVSILLLFIGGCVAVSAQSQANIIKYVQENKLYRHGNTVTVTNINLEWPVALEGNGMTALQAELCRDVLGVEATDLQDGWIKLHRSLGKELRQMPDSVERHYMTATLEELWNAPGMYISFYLTRQETNDKGQQTTGTKRFITYDLINNRILDSDAVFTIASEDFYTRVPFETLLEQNAVCEDEDKPSIDLTKVPQDFALVGGTMAFGLGGNVAHRNFSTVSINNLYQLGMLRRSFVKWISGKQRKKNREESTVTPIDFDLSLSSDTISNSISAIPQFPGGSDSLKSYMRRNINYPETDMERKIQGRVVVSFVVEKDGSLSNITVISPLSPSLDREAVRVVRSMPRWTPAMQNGNTVRTRMSLPVSYRIETKS